MIVTNQEQLPQLGGRKVLVYPIVSDLDCHPRDCVVDGLVVYDFGTGRSWVLAAKGHGEGTFEQLPLQFLHDASVWFYGSSIISKLDCTWQDAELQYYLYTGHPFRVEPLSLYQTYKYLYPGCGVIGRLIPLAKWEEYVVGFAKMLDIDTIQPGLQFYQNKLLNNLNTIQQSGICVDPALFEKRLGKKIPSGFAYSYYNAFTTTGRPSNRFGGVNYAGLNKSDGSRDALISRYPDGVLLELDFKAYHPHLIADLVGYDFGGDDVYEHLARYYEGTDQLDEKDIEKAKETTFFLLYGGSGEGGDIAFLRAASHLKDALWRNMMEKGYITSPVSGRRIVGSNYSDLNKNTLFNYFIQMYETEINAGVIEKVLDQIAGTPIKLVLYTYDSLLFDLPRNNMSQLIHQIIPQCIQLEKFPIKVKTGPNYGNLKQIDPYILVYEDI